MNDEIHQKVSVMLQERLQSGKMEPFYKIGKKMRAWMKKNGIRDRCRSSWRAKYDEAWHERCDFQDEYFGTIYEPGSRMTQRAFHLSPDSFYLEIPSDLVRKSLVLGCFP
jgi:hypothetical protein